ncbi:MAG: glycoside hydrolase 43 family protein [Lachnospiraceae bacterium]|nr:glycoside hydrolase 43 family protein [Lachnospiraceae bacterium]
MKDLNPITSTDCPDPDIIRVEDTYYMVSTTMYFMPGCEILRSYDLVHWEHAAYVYERLDSTPAQCLSDGKNIYGQGMWAASLRFHEGVFTVCFVANDTHKTYLYRSRDIRGPWEKQEIKGFYHDNSILFDDDGKVYIVYGNREIHLTQLSPDLSGPMEGGLDRIIVRDADDAPLGYEGAHFYKINGRYYLFLIHIPKASGRRTQSCFVADSPDGEFTGRDVCDDDRGYCGMGAAQGGIVQTPSGRWYAMLFQDSGAVGRIPVLIPVTWEDGWPVFGEAGRIPEEFPIEDSRPGYRYRPLIGSDDFKNTGAEQEGLADSFGFLSRWQFNHEPELSLVTHDREKGRVIFRTGHLCKNLVQARNTLTQRTVYPGCAATVTLDAAGLNEGDFAGLCLLESAYGWIGVTRRQGHLMLVMAKREIDVPSIWGIRDDGEAAEELFCAGLNGHQVVLCAETDFTMMKDEARFGFMTPDGMRPCGPAVKLRFRLDHFTGVRFGLFCFSTVTAGGSAAFSGFRLTMRDERQGGDVE